MILDVKYDGMGIFKDANLLNLTYKEWILIHVALDTFLKQKLDAFKEVEKQYFEKLESNASTIELGMSEMTMMRMGNDIYDIEVMMNDLDIYAYSTAPR